MKKKETRGGLGKVRVLNLNTMNLQKQLTNEQEIYYAIKEAIQVMTTYDKANDFALFSSLNRLRELEQKLNKYEYRKQNFANHRTRYCG